MKIAVIGSGKWGKNIVRNFNDLGVLDTVADSSPENLETSKQKYPEVKHIADYHELLNSDIDAVAVATPVPTHFEVVKKFLLAGKDVFCEKPITLKVETAQELVKIAEENNRILMVGHILLYQPAIQWIKKYIDEGNLGKVYRMNQDRLNLGRARKAENVLWSLGVHDISVLLYLIGQDPVEMQISGQRILQQAIEDDIYLHMYFENDVHAHIHNSWLWHELSRKLIIVGEKGMLVYDEISHNVTLHKKSIGPDLINVDQGSEVVFEGAAEPLKLELQHFLDCVKTRNQPISDGKESLQVVKVLENATKLLNGTDALNGLI